MSYLIAGIIAVTALLLIVILPMGPAAGRKGGFVAEVWLEWEICRGSTLYRQCFRSRWLAILFAKLYAVRLDCYLPRTYYVEGWTGELLRLKHEFGICYGVRTKTAREQKDARFAPIWTVQLPGHAGFRGEHASAHPLQ